MDIYKVIMDIFPLFCDASTSYNVSMLKNALCKY